MKNSVWSIDELSGIQNVDRLLPSQPYFSKMYKGNDFYGDLQRVLFSVLPGNNFDIKTKEGMTYAVMGSDLNTLRFYQFLIRAHGYKKILELGTYIGVSAMYMADAGAHVITLEKGEEFYSIARTNIINNGFNDLQVCPILGNAIEFLKQCKTLFDFILIDCAKESYKELLELSLPYLTVSGMILIDDVFFQGDILNSIPATEKGLGVRKMLDYVATRDDLEKVILPLGNGLLLIRKII